MSCRLAWLIACAAVVPAEAAQPNVLYIFPDQWRFDWAGFDEPDLRLPNLAALAANGTRFTHAYVPSPLCDPSRGATAAGMEYDESPVKANMVDFPVDGTYKTIYHLLQKAGYHTMVTGKDHLTMETGVGLDGAYHATELGFSDYDRTLDKFEDFRNDIPIEPYGNLLSQHNVTWNGSMVNAFDAQKRCYGQHGMGLCCTDQNAPVSYQGSESGHICPFTDIGDKFYVDNYIEEKAEELLDRRPSGKPWFLWVSFPGPHPPFILTDRMKASTENRTYPLPEDNTLHSPDFLLEARRAYAAEIENIDRLIGKLLAKVNSLGETEETLVIVAADHGEELGDHGNFGKTLAWEGAVHVPLIFKGPGVDTGKVVKIPVETLDVGGTILESAGTTPSENMTTSSLWPLLDSKRDGKTRDFVSSGIAMGPPGHDASASGWRMVLKRFNETAVLKLVCCANGCGPAAGSLLPLSTSDQVGLFNVASAGLETTRGNLLEIGREEAKQMLPLLPENFAARCKDLVYGDGPITFV